MSSKHIYALIEHHISNHIDYTPKHVEAYNIPDDFFDDMYDDISHQTMNMSKSDEWKAYISERMTGKNNPQWGKPTSKKQKEAARVANSVPKQHLSKMYSERYKLGKHNVPVMYGSDNPRSQRVRVENIVYDSVNQCAKMKNISRVTVRNRILSKTERFKGWCYEN